MVDTVMGVVGVILDSPFVKAIIAVTAVAAAASPVMRFFHDRAENKLREREVRAQEKMADATMISARAAQRRKV